MARVVANISELVGDTPLVRLNRLVDDQAAEIYAKIEFQNPGSCDI